MNTNTSEDEAKINSFIQQQGITQLPAGEAKGARIVRRSKGPAGGNGTKTCGHNSERGALGTRLTYEEALIERLSSKIKLEKRHGG